MTEHAKFLPKLTSRTTQGKAKEFRSQSVKPKIRQEGKVRLSVDLESVMKQQDSP